MVVSLRVLTKPQWDAALNAARILIAHNPAEAEARARYREAKEALAALLPDGADTREIILAAVRWDALNDIAAAFAGVGPGIIEHHREAGSPNKQPARNQ